MPQSTYVDQKSNVTEQYPWKRTLCPHALTFTHFCLHGHKHWEKSLWAVGREEDKHAGKKHIHPRVYTEPQRPTLGL